MLITDGPLSRSPALQSAVKTAFRSETAPRNLLLTALKPASHCFFRKRVDVFFEKRILWHYYMVMATVISKEDLRRQAGLFNIEEAAEFIGVRPRLFRYDLTQGRVFRPSIRIGIKRRCYYTVAEVEELRRHYAVIQTKQ